jgi:hypothetical protein
LPDYFSLKIDPESKSIDHIVVENFHPEWRRIADSLYAKKIEPMLLRHIGKENKKHHVPEWYIEFEEGKGLVSLQFGGGVGVYLDERVGKYYSLGITANNRDQAELAKSAMNEYLRYMRLGINFVVRN